jgi:methylase of polypeptide subunit release factors
VLPILEEEQVFMCRHMKTALQERLQERPGALVLDVGTGSGVFAIYAAKLGCRVVAVDVSPRALRMARHNIEKNEKKNSAEEHDIRAVDSFEQLQPGCILLREVRFDEKFVTDNATPFDVVILAPPYNPTCPGVNPALHAEAGEDGQKRFREQIVLAPRILAENGYCIGNQMSLADKNSSDDAEDGRIHALEAIQEAFSAKGYGCHTHYARILPDTIAVESFLHRQYESYLHPDYPVEPTPEVVNAFVERVSAGGKRFALIYYAARKEAQNVFEEQEIAPIERPKCKPFNWDCRVWLHRNIVDHTSSLNTFPLPSLFMEQDSIFDLPEHEMGPTTNTQETGSKILEAWRRSVLRTVAHWLEKANVLNVRPDGSGPMFDVLFVDTAPYYQRLAGQGSLPQECKVWTSNRSEELNLKIIALWQANTPCLQGAFVGPFLHPHFIGTNAPREWRGMQTSVIESGERVHFENEREQQVFNEMLDQMQVCYRPLDLSRSSLQENLKRMNVSYDEKIGYAMSRLESLRVGAVEKYAEAVLQRSSKLMESTNIGGAPDEKTVARDLELCHIAMHEQLRRIYSLVVGASSKWTALIGLPLSPHSLVFDQEAADKDKVPETFRGGVWLYASSSQTWTIKHEEVLLDLARLLWLSYDGRYNVDNAREIYSRTFLELGRSFSHEVRHVSNAMSGTWVLPANDLFDCQVIPESDSSGKIGRMLLYDESLLNDLGVAPIRNVVNTASSQISLWCMTSNPSDLPFHQQRPEKLEEFVHYCWDSAVDVVLLHAFRSQSPSSAANIKRIQQRRAILKQVLGKKPEVLGQEEFPTIGWDVKNADTVAFARVLIALFTNCIQHGDPAKVANVTFERREKSEWLLTFTNDKRRADDEVSEDITKEFGADSAKVVLSYIKVAASRISSLEDSPLGSLEPAKTDTTEADEEDDERRFSTPKIIGVCLAHLKGNIIDWPKKKKVNPGEKYQVKLSFEYGAGASI